MTTEEQFRQAIYGLDLPKVQLEAICNLHSLIYEGVNWKGMYDKLSHLDNYPRVKNAIKVGAAALLGSCPIGGVYNTLNAMDKQPEGDDKNIEQIMDEREDINKKLYPDLPSRVDVENDAYSYKPKPVTNTVKRGDKSTKVQEQSDTISLNQGGAGREKIRDKFDVKFPDASDIASPDSAMRKFLEANLSEAFKLRTTPEQQSDHIDRVLRAVKNTASITADRGIGEAELIALMCVESMFNDKPKTISYKGIAQLGHDAIEDARSHAGEFGLGSAPMRNPEIVEDAIHMAASYLLYIMHDSDRSNKVNIVNGEEDDDKFHGDMRFVFACYNGGIGKVYDKFNKEVSSIPKLYRRVLRGELTPNQAVEIKGSMKEALTYPSKILKVLDYLKSIGMHTNFDSRGYIYSKTKR